MAERHIQGDCEEWARERGIFVRRVIWNGRRDAPDNLFIRDGRHLWVEFKTRTGELSAGQRMEHRRMAEAGTEVHVIRSLQEFRRLVN